MTDIAEPSPPWKGPELCGLAEVAGLLGVTRQRAHQVVNDPDFPAPVQTIAASPIWARPDVETYIEALPPPGTDGRRKHGPRGPRWYYVEVAYHDPDSTDPQPGFTAWVGEAVSAAEARAAAAAETARMHPTATRVEPWKSQVISPKRARRTQAAMTDGTFDPE